MIPVTKNLFRIDPTEAQEQKRQKNKQTNKQKKQELRLEGD